MKAYKISCRDSEHGASIRFAKRGRDLRGCNASECCDCEFIYVSVHRAPDFDKYAPGPVTVRQYLAEGWYWPCQWCERLCYGDDTFEVISDSGPVFCSERCILQALECYRGFTPNGRDGSLDRTIAEIEEYLQRKAVAG